MDYFLVFSDTTFKNAMSANFNTYNDLQVSTELIRARGQKESQIIKMIILIIFLTIFGLFCLPKLFRINNYITNLTMEELRRNSPNQKN